jgi:uncharacterized protein
MMRKPSLLFPLWMVLLLCAAGCAAPTPDATSLPSAVAKTSAIIHPTTTPALAATATAPLPSPTILPSLAPTQTGTATPIPSPTLPAGQLAALGAQLITAAERGDTAAVLRLLAQGAPVNGRDARGRTAVMAATHANRPETVQALLKAGADVNLQDNLQDNPFLYAGAEGLLEILKLTIDTGANPRITNRFSGTALIPASEHGHIEVIRELLGRTDVNVNHVNNLGWTALLEAVILGKDETRQAEVVRLLLAAGADVNLPDKDGVTPLAHARRRGFSQIAGLLQNAGGR